MMNQNEVKDKFESVHLPINCYLWRFCGLLLSFLWLCVGSSKFFARPLKRIGLVSSLPLKIKVSVWKFFPPIPLRKNSFMLGFSPLFIRQPIPYGISYFHFFLRARGYGKPIMCGSLGDFPKDAVVSCLVSDQIPFNLLSICSQMCLNRDLPTFYMQLGFFLQANHIQHGFLLKANHMQPGFVLKVVICPLSICNLDSFQVSLFGRDLLSLMALSL